MNHRRTVIGTLVGLFMALQLLAQDSRYGPPPVMTPPPSANDTKTTTTETPPIPSNAIGGVAFNPFNWAGPIRFESETLVIEGDPGEYKKAWARIPVSPIRGRTFFFVCELKFTGVVPGEAVYMVPKLKAYHEDESRIAVLNIQVTPGADTDWATYILEAQASKPTSRIILEVAMQECEGLLEARNPRVMLNHPYANREVTEENVFPFEVPENPHTTIRIDTSKKTLIPNRILGVNKFARITGNHKGPSDPRVTEILDFSTPMSIRFPAGTMANWYNWRTDRFDAPDWDEWTDSMQNTYQWLINAINADEQFGFDAYAQITKRRNIKPILVLNVLYESPQDAVLRLEDRKSKGVHPTWIEVGNENFFEEQRHVGNVHSVEDYIRVSKGIIAALREANPDMKFAVVSEAYQGDFFKSDEWSMALAEDSDWYEGVVIHPYRYVDNNFLFDRESLMAIIGSYGHMRESIEWFAKTFPGKKAIISEFSLTKRAWNGVDAFISAIGHAEQIMAVIDGWEDGIVEQASIHQYIGGKMALYGFEGDQSSYKLYRKGVLMKMVWDTFTEAEVFDAVVETPLIGDRGNPVFSDIPAISVRAVETPRGEIKLFCVNKLPIEATVDVFIDGAKQEGRFTQETYKEAVDANNYYELDEVPIETKNGRRTITLPSMSINVITLK